MSLSATERQSLITQPELHDLLKQAIAHQGSQRKFAALHGFSAGFINDVVNHRRDISPSLALALGFVSVMVYVPESEIKNDDDNR